MKNKLVYLLLILVLPMCLMFTGCTKTNEITNIDSVVIKVGTYGNTYYNVKKAVIEGSKVILYLQSSKIITSIDNVVINYSD